MVAALHNHMGSPARRASPDMNVKVVPHVTVRRCGLNAEPFRKRFCQREVASAHRSKCRLDRHARASPQLCASAVRHRATVRQSAVDHLPSQPLAQFTQPRAVSMPHDRETSLRVLRDVCGLRGRIIADLNAAAGERPFAAIEDQPPLGFPTVRAFKGVMPVTRTIMPSSCTRSSRRISVPHSMHRMAHTGFIPQGGQAGAVPAPSAARERGAGSGGRFAPADSLSPCTGRLPIMRG